MKSGCVTIFPKRRTLAACGNPLDQQRSTLALFPPGVHYHDIHHLPPRKGMIIPPKDARDTIRNRARRQSPTTIIQGDAVVPTARMDLTLLNPFECRSYTRTRHPITRPSQRRAGRRYCIIGKWRTGQGYRSATSARSAPQGQKCPVGIYVSFILPSRTRQCIDEWTWGN